MTYTLPRKGISSLGVTVEEKTPFWTLFKRDNFENKWVRVSDNCYYTERLAWHVFRDRLVNSPLSLSIRPCKMTKIKAHGSPKSKHSAGCSRHRGVHYNPAKDMLASGNFEYLNGKRVA